MLNEVLKAIEVLESAETSGEEVRLWLQATGIQQVELIRAGGKEGGTTDFVKARISGYNKKAPTLGIIGCLGGVGARPHRLGLVSDADGAIVALACAAKLAKMAKHGDRLPGDVIVTTHISPCSPIIPHEPRFHTPSLNKKVLIEELKREKFLFVLSGKPTTL